MHLEEPWRNGERPPSLSPSGGSRGTVHTGSRRSPPRRSCSCPRWRPAASYTPRWRPFLPCLIPPPLSMAWGRLPRTLLRLSSLSQNLLLGTPGPDPALQATASPPGLSAEPPAEPPGRAGSSPRYGAWTHSLFTATGYAAIAGKVAAPLLWTSTHRLLVRKRSHPESPRSLLEGTPQNRQRRSGHAGFPKPPPLHCFSLSRL